MTECKCKFKVRTRDSNGKVVGEELHSGILIGTGIYNDEYPIAIIITEDGHLDTMEFHMISNIQHPMLGGNNL